MCCIMLVELVAHQESCYVTHINGSVRLVPGLRVDGTVLPLGVSILSHHVGGEELAKLRLASCRRVCKVELVLRIANSSAERRIEVAVSKKLGAHVGVLAVAIKRSVKREVTDRDASKPLYGWHSALHIAIRSCNDYMEFVAPLALVLGIGSSNIASPEDTLDRAGSSVGSRSK